MSNFQILNNQSTQQEDFQTLLTDPRLSWAAKGLYIYLISLANSDEKELFKIEENIEKNSISGLLEELTEYGYVAQCSSEDTFNDFLIFDAKDAIIHEKLSESQLEKIKIIAENFSSVFAPEVLQEEIIFCLLSDEHFKNYGKDFFQKFRAILQTVILQGKWQTSAGMKNEDLLFDAMKLDLKLG